MASRLVPGTEDWIAYAVRATGFHFQLDRRVPGTMEQLAPALEEMMRRYPLHWDSPWLAVDVLRTGTPALVARVTEDWLEAHAESSD